MIMGLGFFCRGYARRARGVRSGFSDCPGSPEGPINRARVHLAEGSLEEAESALIEAEKRHPGYIKTAYFRGEVLNGYGYYDDAIAEWMYVFETYPADRVLLLSIGRMHYLMGRYEVGSAVDGPRP